MSTSAFGVVHKSQLSSGAYKAASALTGTERTALKADMKLQRKLTKPSRVDRVTSPFKSKIRSALGKPQPTKPRNFVDPPQSDTHIRTKWAVQDMANLSREVPGEGKMRTAAIMGMPGDTASTIRTGGKNTGKSTTFLNLNSGLDKTETQQLMRHERAHAKPRRSAWRMAQIMASPTKRGMEEARADRFVPTTGTNVGYDKIIDRPSTDKQFASAYTSMRTKLRNIDAKRQ